MPKMYAIQQLVSAPVNLIPTIEHFKRLFSHARQERCLCVEKPMWMIQGDQLFPTTQSL